MASLQALLVMFKLYSWVSNKHKWQQLLINKCLCMCYKGFWACRGVRKPHNNNMTNLHWGHFSQGLISYSVATSPMMYELAFGLARTLFFRPWLHQATWALFLHPGPCSGIASMSNFIGTCRPRHTQALPGLFQTMRTHVTRTGHEDIYIACACLCLHRHTYSVQCSDRKRFPQLHIKCSVAKSK